MTPFRERVEEFERRLARDETDAAIFGPGPSLYYLSSFAGEADRCLLLLLTADGERTFVTPRSYVGQVRNSSWIEDVRPVEHNDPATVVEGLVAALDRRNARLRLDDRMPAAYVRRLEDELPDATFRLVNELLMPMRMHKDDTEQRAMRRAARATDRVSEEIRGMGPSVIGLTEAELATEIRTRLHRHGAEALAFPVVVAAGPNGARPTQYRHGDRTIEAGDPVVLDFGGVFDHYPSDQTRTIVFEGDPPARFPEIHEVVRDALDAGLAAAEPGMTAAELDAVVRSVVEDRGYGEQFLTGSGHGVGVRAHEPPSIAPDDETPLEADMVFSLEPGIYLEGKFGVRLETLVVLTDEGAEPLNTSPYDWKSS